MKLADLIQGRNQDIKKIRASSKVAEAASKLTAEKIGALLVEDDSGGIAGIISERDIVRGMGLHGADLHDVDVSELMTRDLIRCKASDSVNEAMAMMMHRHIRHLPIFDGEELVGLISLRDLMKHRIMEVQSEAEALREYMFS
jgi:CBS domain-containing protein